MEIYVDLSEIRKSKQKIEQTIAKLIYDFEQNTQLLVQNLVIHHDDTSVSSDNNKVQISMTVVC